MVYGLGLRVWDGHLRVFLHHLLQHRVLLRAGQPWQRAWVALIKNFTHLKYRNNNYYYNDSRQATTVTQESGDPCHTFQ